MDYLFDLHLLCSMRIIAVAEDGLTLKWALSYFCSASMSVNRL